MTTAKEHIKKIVEQYIKENPTEFELLKEAVVMKRAMYADGFEKSADMRPLFEMSEALFGMFITNLEEDEMLWFKTKKGGNWFAKEFKVLAF